MKDNENRGDTFAELKKRIAKMGERLGKVGKQQPQDLGKGTPAVKPAAPSAGARCSKDGKPVTVPSTGSPVDNMRFESASLDEFEDKRAPKGPQRVRMSDPRGMHFVGISHLHKND